MFFCSYPYTESTKLSQEKPLFPDITVCSLFGISWEKIVYEKRDSNSLYNTKFLKAQADVQRYLRGDRNISGSNEAHILNVLSQPNFMFANLGNESAHIGYTINDLILFCTHSGKNCSESDFQLFQTPDYFNCYTYVAGGNYQHSIMAGPDYGLSLILYSEALDLVLQSIHHRYEHQSPIGNSKGIRLVVHTPGSFPNIQEDGIDIMPGMTTSISLVMSKETRIDKPYSNCFHDTKKKLTGEHRTDVNSCRKICKDHLIRKE